MAINDGQPVDASNSNAAWISKNTDDTMVGKLSLANLDPVSGPSLSNIQKVINSVSSFLGIATTLVYNALPSWTYNQVGSSTDPVTLRADLLTQRFDGSSGHAHTGSTGEGPKVAAINIATVRLHGYFERGVDLTGVTGTSTNVSTELTGKTPSGGGTVKGVVVSAPDNKVVLQHAIGVNQGDNIVDGLGNIVYGRVTESVGVWTLSYFVLLSGVETAYTFSSTDVAWFYQELFNPITDAPIYSELANIPSDNVTQDVIDATSSQRGLVNTADQTFGGIKRFLNQLAIRDLSAAFDVVLSFASSVVLTAQRTFTIDLKNVSRTLTMSSDADISGTNTGDQTITLTSDVTGSGTGSFAATIANNAVTNAKAAQMVAHTFKGNNTGSTANAIDLTATQLTAEINNFVGDSGSGGTKGLVIAPTIGDATKFLRGDATWQTVSGGGGSGFNYTSRTSNYTALANDFVNCTSGTFNVTIPSAISIAGQPILVKNSGTGVISLLFTGGQNAEGYTQIDLSNQNEVITIISDGTNWKISDYKFKKSKAIFSTGAAGTDSSTVVVGGFNIVRINLSATLTGGTDITATQDGTNGCKFVAKYKGWVTIECGIDQPGGNDTRILLNGAVYENNYGNGATSTNSHGGGTLIIFVAANDYIQFSASSTNLNTVTSVTHIGVTLEKEF